MAKGYPWGYDIFSDVKEFEKALWYYRHDTGDNTPVRFEANIASDQIILAVRPKGGGKWWRYFTFFTRYELASGAQHHEFRARLTRYIDEATNPPATPMPVDYSLDELELAQDMIKELT